MPNSTTIDPRPVATTSHSSMLDWGIAIAILVFILREGLRFFQSKDASESALTAKLIEDLRGERQQQMRQMGQLLLELKASHQRIAETNSQISTAIAEISVAIQQGKRSESEIFAALRNIERQLTVLSEKIEHKEESRSSR
ncbi:MAG: hypothetical protein ACRCZS_19320 [Chroococcidiopsis sp.]